MDDPTEGKGTVFGIGDGAGPEVFTAVAELLAIDAVGVSRETYSTTTFDAVDDYRKVAGSKLKDPGEFSLELIWDKTNPQIAVLEAKINEVLPSNFKLTWPDTSNSTEIFAAVLTSYSVATPMEEKMVQTFNFKRSGKPS